MKKLNLVTLLTLTAAALASRAPATTLYTNGPVNGTIQAYSISQGFSVSDSFTLTGAASLSSAEVGLFVDSGETPASLSWEIGTTPFVSNISFGVSNIATNTYHNTYEGFDAVYDSTFLLSGSLPGAGTYYFTLLNAVPSVAGDQVSWDQNNGPSTAAQSGEGSRLSESFTLSGTSNVPEPSTWALLGLGAAGACLALRRCGTRV